LQLLFLTSPPLLLPALCTANNEANNTSTDNIDIETDNTNTLNTDGADNSNFSNNAGIVNTPRTTKVSAATLATCPAFPTTTTITVTIAVRLSSQPLTSTLIPASP
jgi:hypothetical protein